jgi:hypothetical protein
MAAWAIEGQAVFFLEDIADTGLQKTSLQSHVFLSVTIFFRRCGNMELHMAPLFNGHIFYDG